MRRERELSRSQAREFAAIAFAIFCMLMPVGISAFAGAIYILFFK